MKNENKEKKDEKNKKKQILRLTVRVLSLFFTVGVCLTAFLNSQDSAYSSSAKSSKVTEAIASSVISDYDQLSPRKQQRQKNVLTVKLRKLAHFAEYAALGFGASVFTLTFLKSRDGEEPSGGEDLTRENGGAGKAGKVGKIGKAGKKRRSAGRARAPGYTLLIWLAGLFCLLFAVFDEVHQLFVPGRAGMYQDVILDFCASLTAALAVWSVPVSLQNRAKAERAGMPETAGTQGTAETAGTPETEEPKNEK